MQSAFIIRNMDSTPEPQSPNMAAATKRRYRKCTHCTSRMSSIMYDNHTLCTKCRKQVCDMTLVCAECHDWPISKCQVFVDYSNSLRVKRESKQRQLRLAAAYASDQSVYETDTDVSVDEPSVPVQNVHVDRLNLGQQKCLVSEEIVVSAGPSTETETSGFLRLLWGEESLQITSCGEENHSPGDSSGLRYDSPGEMSLLARQVVREEDSLGSSLDE